jgi:membrane-bound ClpP family serine protease
MDITLVIVFMLLGIIFFLLEIFFLPGISVGGVAGVLFVAASIWYAFSHLGATAGMITIGGGVVAMGIAIWAFLRSRALEKMALQTELDGKVDVLKGIALSVGDKGITVSRLAPIGKVRFGIEVVEAKSEDGFIDQAVEVEIVEVSTFGVLVRALEQK